MERACRHGAATSGGSGTSWLGCGAVGRCCWAVLGAPTGMRLAPVMGELVATLRRFGELDVSSDVAAALTVVSPATMDRRLAVDKAGLTLRGRSHTKPGSLLKDAIAIRTWAQWDDVAPGFVEIDLVGHEGGNAIGEHAYTLTDTDQTSASGSYWPTWPASKKPSCSTPPGTKAGPAPNASSPTPTPPKTPPRHLRAGRLRPQTVTWVIHQATPKTAPELHVYHSRTR